VTQQQGLTVEAVNDIVTIGLEMYSRYLKTPASGRSS